MHYICEADELNDPGSRGFSISINGQVIDGFIVQQDAVLYAYHNRCPHTGAPLDWVEHQFLDLDQAYIQCAVHDARFTISSGECIAGPCMGDHLSPLTVIQQGQSLYLDAPAQRSDPEPLATRS